MRQGVVPLYNLSKHEKKKKNSYKLSCLCQCLAKKKKNFLVCYFPAQMFIQNICYTAAWTMFTHWQKYYKMNASKTMCMWMANKRTNIKKERNINAVGRCVRRICVQNKITLNQTIVKLLDCNAPPLGLLHSFYFSLGFPKCQPTYVVLLCGSCFLASD